MTPSAHHGPGATSGYHVSLEGRRQPTFPVRVDGDAAMSEAMQTLVQLLAVILSASRASLASDSRRGPGPMLTVAQTATLLGVSRMTVTRKADSGELPCVIMRRGNQKKMRRFPRALIEDLASHAARVGDEELQEYAENRRTSVRRIGPTDV